VTHRIHIPIGDPYYTPLIEQKKNQVDIMLETNGRAWYNIIQSSRQQSSPKPTHLINERRRTQLLLQQDGSNKNHESEDDDEYTTTTTEESDNNSLSNVSPKPQEATARKRRGNLPKSVTAVLKQWLIDHCKNPYPTEVEKTGLKDKTGLTLNQISNWFINARRRLLPQILDDHQHEDITDPIPSSASVSSSQNKRKRKPEPSVPQQGKLDIILFFWAFY
jgi:hypothetical protein